MRHMSSPATEMSQRRKRKAAAAADGGRELAGVGGAGDAASARAAKNRRPRTDDTTNEDTDAGDGDALAPSSSSLVGPKPMPAHIPAPVWGRVLDYLPYGEVRSALLVGKIIAMEAVKHVQTISITNGWEMDVPAARRFANVTEVNILSLLRLTADGVEWRLDEFHLCGATAERIVPFIVGFQKLERVRAGGLDHDSNFVTYSSEIGRYLKGCGGLEYHESHLETTFSLITHLMGAFSTRSLPTTLETMNGITTCLAHIRPCLHREREEDAEKPCTFCSRTLEYFPIKDLIGPPYHGSTTCFDLPGKIAIISERQQSRKWFRDMSEEFLVNFVNSSFDSLEIRLINDDELRGRLKDAAVDMDIDFGPPIIQFLPKSQMQMIDRFLALGFDPKLVSQEYFYDVLTIGVVTRTFDTFDTATFDFLVSRGFPLDGSDLILLDEAKEPALKELRGE